MSQRSNGFQAPVSESARHLFFTVKNQETENQDAYCARPIARRGFLHWKRAKAANRVIWRTNAIISPRKLERKIVLAIKTAQKATKARFLPFHQVSHTSDQGKRYEHLHQARAIVAVYITPINGAIESRGNLFFDKRDTRFYAGAHAHPFP